MIEKAAGGPAITRLRLAGFVVAGVVLLVVGIGVPIVFGAPMGWKIAVVVECLFGAAPVFLMKRWVWAIGMASVIVLMFVVVGLNIPTQWWITGFASWGGGVFFVGSIRGVLWSVFGKPAEKPEKVA